MNTLILKGLITTQPARWRSKRNMVALPVKYIATQPQDSRLVFKCEFYREGELEVRCTRYPRPWRKARRRPHPNMRRGLVGPAAPSGGPRPRPPQGVALHTRRKMFARKTRNYGTAAQRGGAAKENQKAKCKRQKRFAPARVAGERS